LNAEHAGPPQLLTPLALVSLGSRSCTNRGPAFTKGQEDPTEVKMALVDRSVVAFVRTLGTKTHTDEEFEAHIAHPDVAKKVRTFRIVTCLMGMVKLLIYRCAQTVF
jgi:hypothetical protein